MGLGEVMMEESGLPPAAAAPLARPGAQVPVAARVQAPDLPRHAAGDHLLDRRARPATAPSAPRKSARARCCRSCRRAPTRSTTPSACASIRVPIHPHMILKALDRKRAGHEPRYGPASFPEVDFGEKLLVPTPARGRRRQGDQRVEGEAALRHAKHGAGSSGTMSERRRGAEEEGRGEPRPPNEHRATD